MNRPTVQNLDTMLRYFRSTGILLPTRSSFNRPYTKCTQRFLSSSSKSQPQNEKYPLQPLGMAMTLSLSILSIQYRQHTSTQRKCCCELIEVKEDKGSVGDSDDDEKEECPFCRYFLDSPCKSQFKVWQACIDKSAQATDCMTPFHPLKQCMDDNGMALTSSNDKDNVTDER